MIAPARSHQHADSSEDASGTRQSQFYPQAPSCTRSRLDFMDAGMLHANVDERVGARNRTRDKSSWWRLVWCYERCLKEENEVRRKLLSEAARECGALLICLKKASKFEKWLLQEPRPPFVLLTDSKEVKPCIQIASLKAQQNQLAFTIALCESESDFNRVSHWAQTLPARNYLVHVWQDMGHPKSFVRSAYECLLGQARGDAIGLHEDHIKGRHTGIIDQLASRSEVQDDGKFSESRGGVWEYQVSKWDVGGAPRKGSSSGKGRGRYTGRGAARCGKEPAADALSLSTLPDWSRLVYSNVEPQIVLPEAAAGEVNVLSPVCALRSNGQLEQLLKEALPDHYDE